MLPCGINSLAYSSGYLYRGRSCIQVKIVADTLLYVKFASIDPVKKMQLIIISLQNWIFFYQLERHLSLCHIKKSVLFVNIYVVLPRPMKLGGGGGVTQVCFGISIWNFICMLLVAMGRSLLIFSNVTFKMTALQPSWIFRFPDSNFCLALNIKSKLQ